MITITHENGVGYNTSHAPLVEGMGCNADQGRVGVGVMFGGFG